jgi:hypothetical protein
MVYNTLKYWGFGVSLSSGVLWSRSTTLRKLVLFPSSGERGENTPTQLGPLERANLYHCMLLLHILMIEAVFIVRNGTAHIPDYTVSQRSADCASYTTLLQKVNGCLRTKQYPNVLEFLKQNCQLKLPADR